MKTRIQVSIHPNLVAAAESLMQKELFSSFSGYIEKLIREEYARRQADGTIHPRKTTEEIKHAILGPKKPHRKAAHG